MPTKLTERRELWRQRVAQQEASGESIRAYCQQRGLSEHAFYNWRQRLSQEPAPVSFALVETQSPPQFPIQLEFLLPGGERLRIPAEEHTLRLVLRALHSPQS